MFFTIHCKSLKSNEISVTLILKICKMYPVAINNLVKLACASYLISMSKADTLTFVYKDYRISFSLNYGKKQRRRNIKTILIKCRTFRLLSWFSRIFDVQYHLEISCMLKSSFLCIIQFTSFQWNQKAFEDPPHSLLETRWRYIRYH